MNSEQADPARLAAIDQQLAAIDARLEQHARTIMRGDLAIAVTAAGTAIWILAARPQVHRWELLAAVITCGLLAFSGFIQGLMLRSYRAEIRELRSRP